MKRLIEQARNEGLAQGRADVLLRIMALRFGQADAPTMQQVRSASLADLDRWAERILTATSVADLLSSPAA